MLKLWPAQVLTENDMEPKELKDYIKALTYIGYVVLALLIGLAIWAFI